MHSCGIKHHTAEMNITFAPNYECRSSAQEMQLMQPPKRVQFLDVPKYFGRIPVSLNAAIRESMSISIWI